MANKRVYYLYKLYQIPYLRVYTRVFDTHKPKKGFLYVAISHILIRVYERHKTSNKPFERVSERVYDIILPFQKPVRQDLEQVQVHRKGSRAVHLYINSLLKTVTLNTFCASELVINLNLSPF